MFSSAKLSKEIDFVVRIIILYVLLIKWGYLQEKITSTGYVHDTTSDIMSWKFPFALNFVMATGSTIIAYLTEILTRENSPHISFKSFWKAALTCAVASPIGYQSLKFISFPLMILTKSSKPVPVMFVGVVLYKQSYKWYKYLSVFLICVGIGLFSSYNKTSTSTTATIGSYNLLIGITLVLLNLFLDGLTNNEQDLIFYKEKATSLQMMKYTNLWQAIYLLLFLIILSIIQLNNSELYQSIIMIQNSSILQRDIIEFCLCSGIGQVLIFGIMKDYGSLAWVTISVTRKLFTILFSVFLFGHHVKAIQWFGIVCVFLGMTVDVVMSYNAKKTVITTTTTTNTTTKTKEMKHKLKTKTT